jgi:hypothetical protein
LDDSPAGGGESPVPLRGVVSPRRLHREQSWDFKPGVVRFYNKRGTAEQWIKEGKQAVALTRLSCHRFRANEVRLWLSLFAYNLGNLWRRLALPTPIGKWSLTSLQQRLVKTGGRLIQRARYYWLLLAESHLTRRLFGNMLQKITAFPSQLNCQPGGLNCLSEKVGPFTRQPLFPDRGDAEGRQCRNGQLSSPAGIQQIVGRGKYLIL